MPSARFSPMTPMPRLLSCLVLAGVAPLPAQAPPRNPVPPGFPAAWRGTAEFFHATLTHEGVVGGSLWFLRGDSVLAREFHGLPDGAPGRKVAANTIFHWASLTQPMTGIPI